MRTAIAYLRHPWQSANAIGGALGWWAGNIGILWASFHAFSVSVPFGVVVQGYFLGMVANLAPSPAAGVGTVDAGLIGAFVLFGIPAGTVFPAILVFRLIAFWLPIPAGVPTVTPQPQFVPTSLPYKNIVEANTGRFPVFDHTAVQEIPAGQTDPVTRPDGPTRWARMAV